MRGGKREGAGRKHIGMTKKVSLTLPENVWERIEHLCIREGKKYGELLREIVEKAI